MKMHQLDVDVKVLIAEVTTKMQSQSERMEEFMTVWKENHGAAHEVAMQQEQHGHEHELADKQTALAAQQASTEGANDGNASTSG